MNHSGNSQSPPHRGYRRGGGRPYLEVDFVAVCDAVLMACNGSGESITASLSDLGLAEDGSTNGSSQNSAGNR